MSTSVLRTADAWWVLHVGDCRAYLGISVPGFPNLFMTSGPNPGVVVNGSAIFSSECQVEYSLRALRHVLGQGFKTVDCRTGPRRSRGGPGPSSGSARTRRHGARDCAPAAGA